MSKVLNLANELRFSVNRACNGFHIITEEPSDMEEDTIVQRSYVIEQAETSDMKDSELDDLVALRKLFWQMKEFFGVFSNYFYFEIKILDKESGKEVELD